MPGNASRSQAALQTLSLKDFTKGIHSLPIPFISSSVSGYRTPSASLTASPNTYGCMGMPDGGLLLGPVLTQLDSYACTFPASTSNPFVSGVVDGGFIGPTTLSETWIAVGFFNASSHEVDQVFDFPGSTTGPIVLNNASFYLTNSAASFGTVGGPSFPFTTLVYWNPGGGLTYEYAVCLTSGFNDNNTQDHMFFTANGPSTFDTGRVGIIVPANGRVWLLSQPSNYTNSYGTYWFFINYTDPLLGVAANVTMGTNQTLVAYDNPTGFGAWGQLATGQNLLVKSANEGGVIVTGDIFNPSVTVANAVQGTNGYLEQSAATPLGLIYFSRNYGVYAWSGGESSQLLSGNVSPSLFTQNILGKPLGYPNYTSPPGINSYYLYNSVFFSGGYFYSLSTNSFWRLPPYFSATDTTNYFPSFYYQTNNNGSSVGDFQTCWFGTPGTANNFNVAQYCFDPSTHSARSIVVPPTGYFNSFFESNPIILDPNHFVEVEEIDVVIQGSGTLNVTSLGVNGAALMSRTITINSTTYQKYRIVVDFLTDVVVLQLGFNWAESSHTPIIAEVDIQYRTTYPIEAS